MFVDFLLTFPIVLLFFWLAVRCFASWGAPVSFPPFLLLNQKEEPYSPSRRELVSVFAWAMAFRLLMLLAFYAAVMFMAGTGTDAFRGKLQLWDARHYVNLIQKGYAGYQEDGQHLFVVFYPLYVWLVRLINLIIPQTEIAGLTVSFFCYSLGCCFTYRLAAGRWGKAVAGNALLFLSLFPFSFFYGTVMTESLFLLTASAACYYALNRKWLLYGIFGVLASLTRMTGILVMIPAAIELLEDLQPLAPPLKKSLKNALPGFGRKLPALLAPLLGAAGYLALNYSIEGNPFAFVTMQKHWHTEAMWISRVLRYITDYLYRNMGQPIGWAIWIPELALFILFFCILVLAARKRRNPPSLLAYGFCYLVVNYSLSWLVSGGRYLSGGFLFFILAAELTERHPRLRQFILCGEAVFLGIYLCAYVSGDQIM